MGEPDGKEGGSSVSQRDRFLEEIKAVEEQIKTAGPIHRRDLIRQIKRMKRELRTYDRYHRGCQRLGEKALMQSG